MGKVGNNEGDTLEFPTTELEYDLFQYLNHEQPNYAYTKAREIHGDPNTRWQESYTYTDGLGRVLLEKAKVAPGKAFIFIDGELQYGLDEKPLIDDVAPRWLGSGRIVYNNKGEPVKQYEPYFSNTPEYEKESEAREFGVSPLLHYDALGRNNRIDHPDGSFEKVVFDCWQQKNYDRNDTVKDSEWYAERDSPQPSDPEPTDPRERAAWLAIKHYDTPEILDLDVLGVIYRQRHDNGTYDGITTTHIYYDTIFATDIEGKRRKVTDARELEISYQYDMRPIQEDEEGNSDGGTVIQSESPDSGLKIQLVCVDGQPLFAVDAVGNHFLYDYDALRRPLRIKTKINGAANYITTALYEYGESLVNPEQYNLRGQLYQIYDASGFSQNNVFDFKGNLLSSQKQLLEDATLSEVDWEGNTSLDLSTEVFESSMTYDALNRLFTQTDPGGNTTENTYDEGGALKTIKLNGANYVQDIHYNEKGQREAIWYGNGTKTSYTYDEFTFRLRRLLTVKLNANDILQDLNYWYDPVGNITEIQDDAQQTLFFNNAVITPTQKFVYDALYRLIEAKGRELIGTADFGATDNWNDAAWQTTHKGDGNSVQNYTQKYIYDEVGIFLELQHIAGIGSYTRNYSYDINSNKLLSTEVGSNTYSYSHDAQGNMIEMPHLSSLAWNTQNELKSIMRGSKPTCYQYSNGERVRKFTDKGTIKEERIYLGNFEIYRKFDNTSSLIIERQTVHVSDDTGRIAMLEKRTTGSAADDNGTDESLERYVYSNHLQSASLELDKNAEIISYEEYHPYGTTSYQANNSDIKAVAKRYRYTGKEKDEESRFYYHGARYYVPWLARWTATDPNAADAPAWSSYRAFFCNSIRYSDPDGTWEWDAVGNLVAQKNDNTQTLASFLNISPSEAATILNRNGISGDKGPVKVMPGNILMKPNMWTETRTSNVPVVNNSTEATSHYFNGKGVAADVGWQSTNELISSEKFIEKFIKITTQTVEPTGYFSVDLTTKPYSFHIGNTNVDYRVEIGEDFNKVRFVLFARDGFWDPDFIVEKILGGWLDIDRFKPDRKGPNLERFDGTPYDYKTRERTYFFKPVEEQE